MREKALGILVIFATGILPAQAASTADASGPSIPVTNQAVDAREAIQQIEAITRQIILKEIELERFNLRFRKAVGREDRWKGWRYFLSQQANFSLSEAGSIVSVSERMSNIHKPNHPNREVLKHAAALQEIGPIISAAGSGLEFGIAAGRRYVLYRHGLSPGLAKKVVWESTGEIDKLMAERQKLIEQELKQPELVVHAEIAEAEGRVLEDIKYLLIAEYRTYHLDTRRFMAFQQSLYLLDILKRSVGATAAGISYRSQRLANRRLNRPIGILTTVSGALVVAAPVLSREIGKWAAIYHDRYLRLTKSSRADVFKEITQLNLDRRDMDKLVGQTGEECKRLGESCESRLAIYESVDKGFIDEVSHGLKQERAGARSATENILAGAFSGSTTMVAGILLTRAGYAYFDNGLLSNALIGSGATANLAGNSFAFFDNIRIQMWREWINHRLRSQHQLPNQLIDKRMDELDLMEKQITGAK